MNYPITIDRGNLIDPLKIAEKELEAKTIPLVVRRYLPDGNYEDWSLTELLQ